MSEFSSPTEPAPEFASDKELGGLAGFILQAVSGSLMLLCVYLFITMGASVSIITVLIAGLFTPVLNFVWISVSIALIIYGARRRMPGITWSPVIFCILWFSTAVIHRTILAMNAGTITTETIKPNSLPADLSQTTLTIIGTGEGCCWYYKILATKQIAAFAWGETSDLDRPSSQVRLITYAEGEACRKANLNIDKGGTAELRKIGRLDECFLRHQVVGVPDGLIIKTSGSYTSGSLTNVIVREDGRDRTVIDLGRQGGTTLAYLPIIGIGAPFSINTWGAGLDGILRAVRGEKVQTADHRVVLALFGRDAFTPL